MKRSLIALFGEAEKGEYNRLCFCSKLEELYSFFGGPPVDSEGLFWAIQSLRYGQNLLYCRVTEEGMSSQEYLSGLRSLYSLPEDMPLLRALFLPKVGSREIIEEGLHVCEVHHSLLIIKEADLFDYLTSG